MEQRFSNLFSEIDRRKKLIKAYLAKNEYAERFRPEHIRDATYWYVTLGGKSLRPAVLMLSCGAVGGSEEIALPAAAAIEVYHTWTLVHDDIIDKDHMRRGVPTVHKEFERRATLDLGWKGHDAEHYGLAMALLAGDMLQAWSTALLCELSLKYNLAPALVLQLVFDLTTYLQPILVEGEALDIQYSKSGDVTLSEDLVTSMLWKKTGVLYECAGRMGAAIGLQDADPEIPIAKAISRFCSNCGTAFQIQDDILGMVGDEAQLGKPVGSDIREGKRTIITLKLIEKADTSSRAFIEHTLGNPDATPNDIRAVIQLAHETGAIKYSEQLARQYIDKAIEHLGSVTETDYRRLLLDWAHFLVEREF